jgi:hypothetical protein
MVMLPAFPLRGFRGFDAIAEGANDHNCAAL